jgi:hypothetical protein
MDESSIKDLICDLFLAGDRGFPLEPATDLLREGICDSLGLVQIATHLERRLSPLRIHDADVTPENLGSIARIHAFLKSRVRA